MAPKQQRLEKRSQLKIINFFTLLAIILYASPSVAQDYTGWPAIDRLGLYNTAEEGQLNKDIWQGHTQSQAVLSVNSLPNTLQHDAYRSLAKKLLLSSAPFTKEEVNSPALLTARLEKLISYGMIDETKELFDKVKDIDGADNDFGLESINLSLNLLDNNLAPICLDIQASESKYRDITSWRELSSFCKLRFGNGDKINFNELKFVKYPNLAILLRNQPVRIDANLSNIETLIANADNQISVNSYNHAIRTPQSISDLTTYLALDKKYKTQETYQCYAIEAAKRGIIDTERLATLYKEANFSADLLTNNGGTVELHPCDVPAYFYQRLELAGNDTDKKSISTALLKPTMAMPIQSLMPMASHLETLDENNSSFELAWRWASIQSLSGGDLPQNDLYLPLYYINKGERIPEKSFLEWLKLDRNTEFLKTNKIDPASLLYISQTLSNEKLNFQNNAQKLEYGNIFMLTYAGKSASLGLGFNDYMQKLYDKGNNAMVIINLLTLLGNTSINDIHVNEVSVILSTLSAYKLEKKAITLAFEYLQ